MSRHVASRGRQRVGGSKEGQIVPCKGAREHTQHAPSLRPGMADEYNPEALEDGEEDAADDYQVSARTRRAEIQREEEED